MILESHCYACERTMPAFLWNLHLWWFGCPGKTAAQHDEEHGLIFGGTPEHWADLVKRRLIRVVQPPPGTYTVQGVLARRDGSRRVVYDEVVEIGPGDTIEQPGNVRRVT